MPKEGFPCNGEGEREREREAAGLHGEDDVKPQQEKKEQEPASKKRSLEEMAAEDKDQGGASQIGLHVSHNLNSLKRVHKGLYRGLL